MTKRGPLAAVALSIAVTLCPIPPGSPRVAADSATTDALFVVGRGLGANRTTHLTAPSVVIVSPTRSPPDLSEVIIDVRRSATDWTTDRWYFEFAGPRGETLVPGTYFATSQTFLRPEGEAGFHASGDSSCGEKLAAEFTIHELERNESSVVTRFAATFEVTCGSAVLVPGAITRGEIRYRSSLPWSAWTMPDRVMTFPPRAVGSSSDAISTTFAAAGQDPSALEARITGTNASDFDIADPYACLGILVPGASCAIAVSVTPTGAGTRTAALQVSSDGFRSVHQVDLYAHGRALTSITLTAPSSALYPTGLRGSAALTPVGIGGSVAFRSGGQTYGQAGVYLYDGTAENSFVLPPGDHDLVAHYYGITNYEPSTSSPLRVSVRLKTQTRLIAPAEPLFVGAPVDLYAVVDAPAVYELTGGTISIVDVATGEVLASRAVSGADRDLRVRVHRYLPIGWRTFEARYSGHGLFAASSTAKSVALALPPPVVDVIPPVGSVTINSGHAATSSATVTLTLNATDPLPGRGVEGMQISLTSDPYEWSPVEAFIGIYAVTLPGADGPKRVHARFSDAAGNMSLPVSDEIVLDRVAPIPVVPGEGFVVGSTAGATVPVLSTYWTTDDRSGIARYQLDQSTSGGAYASVEATPRVGETSRNLRPGSTIYRFRTRAKDVAGNRNSWLAGPTVQLSRIDESASSVAYTGPWRTVQSTSASGGSFRQSGVRDASATFKFSGRDVAVATRVGPNMGRVAIYVDGKFDREVDLYSPTVGWRRIVYATSLANGGVHTLQVRVTGAKNAQSTGTTIAVDALLTIR